MTGTSLKTKKESMRDRRGELRLLTVNGRGFTILELLICLGIMMVLTAIAVPRVINAVALTRLRSAAAGVSALAQQARATAEKQNAKIPFYLTNVGPSNVPGAFISCSTAAAGPCPDGAAWAVNDPYLPFTESITNSAAPPAVVPQASLGFTTQPAGNTLYFTPLGAISNAPAGTFTAKGFVFYLKDNRNNWAAVSVSPTGRTKVWQYTANTWQ